MIRKENEFNFTINGDLDQIEVHTLSGSLLALNELIKDVSYEMGTNKKVELTIKTYKPGSFDVFLQLVADAIAVGTTAGIFSGTNIAVAHKVIEFTTSLLNLKKWLNGQKPEQVMHLTDNRIQIKDNKGNVLVVDKLVFEMASNNEKVDKHIADIFKSIENKETVTGVSIKDYKNETKFQAKKDDGSFDVMLRTNPVIKEEEEEYRDKEIDDAILSVYTLTFGDAKKWEFYYQGNRIPVKVLDQDFMEKVINREYHFANGDRIKCKMIVHQVWNKIAMVFENKSYSIIQVYGAPIPPNPQSKMDL